MGSALFIRFQLLQTRKGFSSNDGTLMVGLSMYTVTYVVKQDHRNGKYTVPTISIVLLH